MSERIVVPGARQIIERGIQGPPGPSVPTNEIGTPGLQGFGVGVCPALPSGYAKLSGSEDAGSANYGNYQYADGSIMVWIPAFYYKWGTGANGFALNAVDIRAYSAFVDVAAANAAGYALHRAFYDGGAAQRGLFVDKYLCSNSGGVASSIALGNPLSSQAGYNPFSGLTGAPADNYGGAIAAAKTRGANFFCNTRFIFAALALLAYAHGRAATGIAWCAWYDAAGVKNFPKGNNNHLVDANDTGVTFTLGSYANQSKAGSGVTLAKTTHNGQASGIADLNGNLWEINPGLTSEGSLYYALKTSVQVKSLTGGNTLATDLWGAAGIAANYDSLGAAIGAAAASNSLKLFGNAGQVFAEAVAGASWQATSAGIPLAGGVGGTNAFGNDGLWDYRPNELCPISGGHWSDGSVAGVWALILYIPRAGSLSDVGFRSASYL